MALGAALTGCRGERGEEPDSGRLGGSIEIDGSSTVFPITEAVAEDFMAGPGAGVRVTVGISGTGGGFKRFCAGETDISDAS
ncbi:MAG: substrate-binding domain-containing protein, partial [Gemmatimonadetes bacterium]|nr:substrate-binding domain-containing protein [Gemmatimonadota bacterium]